MLQKSANMCNLRKTIFPHEKSQPKSSSTYKYSHTHTDSPSLPKKVTAKLRLPQNDKKNNYGHGFPENQLRDVQIWPLALFLFGFFFEVWQETRNTFFGEGLGSGGPRGLFFGNGVNPPFPLLGSISPLRMIFLWFDSCNALISV